MTDFYDFTTNRRAIRINPEKPFSTMLDLSKFVKKLGAEFICSECQEVLVRIQPGGILGDTLNQLDTAVVLDHHLAKHGAMRPPNVDPRFVWGP
jgi:hypothetical protein